MSAPRQRLLMQAAIAWGSASRSSTGQCLGQQTSALLGLQHLVSPHACLPDMLGRWSRPLFGGKRMLSNHITENPKLASVVLEQVQVQKLRQELQDEAELRVLIPYTEFVARALAGGAARSEAEAEELCNALQRAGIVLRHNSTVYLQACEIAEMVMMLLPGGREDTEARLGKVEAELARLEPLHQEAEKTAHRTTDILLGIGGVVLFLQLVGFTYLTWWELSWDVMEPFGYVISLFYSFVAYMYFMWTRGKVFDLKPFRDTWSQRFKAQSMAHVNFDEQRYNYLIKLRDRYKRQLQHLRLAPDKALEEQQDLFAPPGGPVSGIGSSFGLRGLPAGSRH